jgi:hypothetical protein
MVAAHCGGRLCGCGNYSTSVRDGLARRTLSSSVCSSICRRPQISKWLNLELQGGESLRVSTTIFMTRRFTVHFGLCSGHTRKLAPVCIVLPQV